MPLPDAIERDTAASPRWLSIVGIGEDGVDGLSAAARGLIGAAEIVFGGRRHLAWRRRSFAARRGRGRARSTALPTKCCIIAAARSACWPPAIRSITASARCWRDTIDPREMIVVPAPSAFSLAAARLGWSLPQTVLLSVHGRTLDLVRPHLQPGARILALTSDGDGPAALARLLAQSGFGGSRLTVLEALGGPRERIRATTAAGFRPRHDRCAQYRRHRSRGRAGRAHHRPQRPASPTICSSMTARSPSARCAR